MRPDQLTGRPAVDRSAIPFYMSSAALIAHEAHAVGDARILDALAALLDLPTGGYDKAAVGADENGKRSLLRRSMASAMRMQASCFANCGMRGESCPLRRTPWAAISSASAPASTGIR